MRALKRVFIAIAVILALPVIGTLVPRPLLAPEPGGAPTRRILVVANPIHTDIALPLDAALAARLPWLTDSLLPFAQPGTGWVLFGWGGRAFYIETPTWADLKPGPVLKALTLDSAVMHVEATGDIDIAHPAVTAFDIDDAAYARLLDFIAETFVTDAAGRPTEIPNVAYTAYDAFFEARGSFNLFLGCNDWTAEGLRVAGLRTGWWNPLPQSLAISLSLYGKSVSPLD